MHRFSIMKHIYKVNSQFTHQKVKTRFKTDNISSTSEFCVTEEQIQQDSLGNKPPQPPGPDICCGNLCNNCVWLAYVIEVKYYVNEDGTKIKEVLDSIPNPEVKAFVEFEMKDMNGKQTN